HWLACQHGYTPGLGIDDNQAWNQTEPEQPNQLLSRTEPSPSDRVMLPSKPNQACTATEPSRADPPLGSVARCHTQIHANAHSCMLYVCYTHAQPIRSQQCTGRQGQHGGTLRRDPAAALPSQSEARDARWRILQREHRRAQAALLLGSVRPSRARAADWAAQPNRAEPERQGHTTEQAEPSMQATEPSLSGPSARFARFDSRPASPRPGRPKSLDERDIRHLTRHIT